jgi:hypothetical protein
MEYSGVNEGRRNYQVRLGCERVIFLFIRDYAQDLGITRSAALRRLMLIGARCESEHGKRLMPASYANLTSDPIELMKNDPWA